MVFFENIIIILTFIASIPTIPHSILVLDRFNARRSISAHEEVRRATWNGYDDDIIIIDVGCFIIACISLGSNFIILINRTTIAYCGKPFVLAVMECMKHNWMRPEPLLFSPQKYQFLTLINSRVAIDPSISRFLRRNTARIAEFTVELPWKTHWNGESLYFLW